MLLAWPVARFYPTKIVALPKRLVVGFFLLLSHVPCLQRFILTILPSGWPRGRVGAALRLAIGKATLQFDRPEHAWYWSERILRTGRATTEEYFLAAVCLFEGLGCLREAKALFAKANKRNEERAQAFGAAHCRYRVLDSTWVRQFGDSASLDYVIKLGILEGRSPEDTILYLPASVRLTNRFLVEQLTQHLRLVQNAADLPFDEAAVEALNFHYIFPQLSDGTTAFYWEIACETQRRWHKQKRGPLLKLPPDIEARGWARLRRAGLPEGAWFITLHVRDIRWKGVHAGMNAIRNADVASYVPGIHEITSRGGWVVRMGNIDSTPMPQLPNVIDYTRSDMRADWMDIFLFARSRFLLGTSSGPSFVPPLYGVPVLLTNWWPAGMRPWHPSDIFMPKMVRRLADGRYLTLSETLREPFSHCFSARYLREHELVSVEDNESEVIREAVLEMLRRMDGDLGCDPVVSQLRLRADEIYQTRGITGMATLASGFLRRHSNHVA